ncbi:hypothetical protein B0H10DRAFT_1876810 [Mycena sp. CBHHK59/15]|nr:hypothetical protein B0H10DRAFT_1876810 [Mycena sp. CBHHK59/15]
MTSTLPVRCLRLHRTLYPRSRFLSTTPAWKNEKTPDVGAIPAQRRPIGAFRGGIVGFLFGFSIAASFAAYNLLDEYNQASVTLQASVEELKLRTEQISAHVRRIEAVEKDLKVLSASSSTKDDLSRLRTEVKKICDGLRVEFLDLRSHIWGIQQDVHSLSKKDTTSVRI